MLKKNNKFVIHNMNTEDFFSTENIETRVVNRKLSVTKQKISWMNTKVIKIDKDKPFSIFFKETHSMEEYQEVDIAKPVRGRKCANCFGNLTLLYPNGKLISEKKMADIKSLLKFIPQDARHFYKIGEASNFDDDIDGYGESIDFDIEFQD